MDLLRTNKRSNNHKFEVSETMLLCIFILGCIPFFTPEGLGFTGASKILVLFRKVQSLEVVLLIMYEIVFYFSHIFYLGKTRYRKRFLMFCCVSLLAFMQIFCTVINHGDVDIAFQRICILMGTYIIVENFVYTNARVGIKAFMYIFFAACMINLLVIFLLHGNMGFRSEGDFWLFGQKNAMRNIVIPAITFSAIWDRLEHKKYSIRTIFLVGTGMLALVIVNSGASTAVIMIFAALLLFLNMTDFELLDLKKICVIYIILEILIVFERRIDLFAVIIEGVLNRDVTLTNRTFIWDRTLNILQEKFLFGDGLRSLTDSKLIIGSFKASHAHNALLDILLKCGIVGAVLLIVLVYQCMRQQFKMKDSALGAVLGMTVGTFLLAGLVGELWNFGFYLVIFCLYFLPEIVTQVEDGSIIYERKRRIRFKFK